MDPLAHTTFPTVTERPSERRREAHEVSVQRDSGPARHPMLDESCIVCGSQVGDIESCCSLSCAETAQRELRDNATRLRRLPRHPDLARTRHLLAERNGQLSSALMRWRPSARPASDAV